MHEAREEGTFEMQVSKRGNGRSVGPEKLFEVARSPRPVVSADGHGVVSHAGIGLLRETAEETGLVEEITAALLDTYRGPPVHAPGRVFTDLAVAVADGADAVSGIAALVDRQELFGPVASMPTTWRVLDRVRDREHLDRVRAARAVARAAAWAAGAGPDLGEELLVDFDATITIAHSEKENAAATWKKTFGFHSLLSFLDRADIAAGEALGGLLRPGNAGSNTAADHVEVLAMSVAALPVQARPRPGDPEGPRVIARSDSAGATHLFAEACRTSGLGFSFGYSVDQRIKTILEDDTCDVVDRWVPAIEADGSDRTGAWVVEVSDLIDLSSWPEGTRLILRKERPHPGAQLTWADLDGHRITAFITDTHDEDRDIADLELRHRQHARVEDRIRQAKATGLRNMPCKAFPENQAWLEVVLTAVDLICWVKKLCFAEDPDLARCEIAAFRYRVLHVAARLVHTGRRLHLKIDETWAWATQIADGFTRIRAAFT